MKQLIAFIIVLFIVVFSGIWEITYLNESGKYLMSDIRDIYQISMRGEYEAAENDGGILKENWKELKKTWALFINDGEIASIEYNMVNFISYIDTKNEEEISKEYNLLMAKIKNVVAFQELKVENVF